MAEQLSDRETEMTLSVGDKAPDFSMSADGGGEVSLANLRGQSVVLYFYPKDDTPGCTIEVCGFRDKYELFKILGAKVCGVNNSNEEKFIAYEKPEVSKKDPLKMELQNFISSIQGKETPIVSGKDGRDALKIAIEIQEMIIKDLH